MYAIEPSQICVALFFPPYLSRFFLRFPPASAYDTHDEIQSLSEPELEGGAYIYGEEIEGKADTYNT